MFQMKIEPRNQKQKKVQKLATVPSEKGKKKSEARIPDKRPT